MPLLASLCSEEGRYILMIIMIQSRTRKTKADFCIRLKYSLTFFYRFLTFFYYLNEPEEGGETAFPIADNEKVLDKEVCVPLFASNIAFIRNFNTHYFLA